MSDTIKVKCGLCGKVTQQKAHQYNVTFGACDLDTRPAPPLRYQLGEELQVCPHCGYVAEDLTEKIRGGKDIVLLDDYIILGKQKYPEEVENYCKAAFITKNEESKFYYYLSCAWIYDDKDNEDLACNFRNKALEIGEGIKDKSVEFKLIMVDLFRRTKRFDEAKDFASKINDELTDQYKAILKLQNYLIDKKIALCYNLKEAIEFNK